MKRANIPQILLRYQMFLDPEDLHHSFLKNLSAQPLIFRAGKFSPDFITFIATFFPRKK